jgi:hypothetical protein
MIDFGMIGVLFALAVYATGLVESVPLTFCFNMQSQIVVALRRPASFVRVSFILGKPFLPKQRLWLLENNCVIVVWINATAALGEDRTGTATTTTTT